MSDTDSNFPSITFPATFEGAAAIGADFNTCLKFKPANALKVLSDLKALPRGTYDVTVVARQAQAELAGDSVDREWAEMTLLDGDASELVYERTCLGARCPVFAVHSSGKFEGRYVCEDGAHIETYMEVVHGETRCPRFAGVDVADELPAEDENTSTGADPEAVVNVWYPGEEHARITDVGEHTLYGEFVADYLATLPVKNPRKNDDVGMYQVVRMNDANLACNLGTVVVEYDYGLSFRVEPVAVMEEGA